MKNNSSHTIFIVAGEPSGDLLGSYLATAFKRSYPECVLEGVGGYRMQQAGVQQIFDSERLAMVGFVEIIKKIAVLRQAMNVIMQRLTEQPPTLLLLIDYPGFNLRLAAKAKALGIKVMYYVSPQIWAWHYSRIKKIKKNVDLMAVLFRFEEKLYQAEHVPVAFVGHPIIEALTPSLTKQAAYQQFSLDPQQPIVALLPGSRATEIQRLLPDMLAAVQCIRQQKPQAQFVLALAPNLSPASLASFQLQGIEVVENNTYNVLSVCDAAIVASGTATLEVAVLGVPQVIVYRVNPLSYQIAKWVATVTQVGLCNIVAEEPVALELIQGQFKPQAVADEILKLLNDSEYRCTIVQKLQQLKARLDSQNAAQQAVDAAVELINA